MLALVLMAVGSPSPAASQEVAPPDPVVETRPADKAVEAAPDDRSVDTALRTVQQEISIDTAAPTAPPDERPPVDTGVQTVLEQTSVDTAVSTAPRESRAPAEPLLETTVQIAPAKTPAEPAQRTARDEASLDPAAEAPSDETLADTASEPASDATADGSRAASRAVTEIVDWVNASGDNGGLPFVVIDKTAALVFVYDGGGVLLAATPALLGSALGDDSTPGVGDMKLSEIPKDERVTPAGRFLAAFGFAAGERKVLWVDYETAISLHPVVTANRAEHRLDRLHSASPDDNRITYGCINIPARVYEQLVRPLFTDSSGVVYILPEVRSLDEVFPTLHAQIQPAPAGETTVVSLGPS